MFRHKGWVVVAFCSASVACGESATEVPPPALTVSPDTIAIVEPQAVSSLFLASSGQTAGNWQISSKPGWVTITPESGSLTGDIIQVQVEADLQALSEPVTVGTIHVISDAGSGSASVKVELDYTPRVSMSESDLQIGATDDQATLRVTNAGRSALTWTLSSPEPWLVIEPSSGRQPCP